MHDQLRHLIISSSLVLGACDYEDELELEQPEQEQPEPGQPTAAGNVDEVAAASSAELRSITGLDQDCVDVNGPIIVRIDPLTTDCEFNGFQNFESDWEAASLFEAGSPMLESLGIPLPTASPLREFCRYEYIGTGASRDVNYANFMGYLQGPSEPVGVDGDSAAVDCPVIAPMTDQGLDTQEGRASLHEAFMTNIHAVGAEDLPASGRKPMQLVLLDTVAEGFEPYNEHGRYLEDLIANIACPSDTESCMDMVSHVLVTPRVPDDRYRTAEWRGGNVGFMHEFSMGLAYAVLNWGEGNLPLPLLERQRLVVSAAVGADPNHPIASDPTFAPAQSAIVALEAAYCMGATVYAAAGNTRDNSCPNAEQFMLAPASYESFTAPTEAQCLAWGYVADYPDSTFEPGSPLIHAVGGLNGVDQPISNHRRLAHPRLNATAFGAISKHGTVAVTGTSVATAVAASAHLLLWGYKSEWSGPVVAAHIYDTGHDTGRNADSGMYVGQPIQRIGICQVLADALELDCKNPEPDTGGNLQNYMVAIENAIEVADLAHLLVEFDLGDARKGEEADCVGGPTFDLFLRPQPERPACSNCNGVLSPPGFAHMLNMSIAPQSWVANQIVTSAYLHTYNGAGVATTFNLSTVVPSINLAQPANVIAYPFDTGGAVPASAVLEFVYFNAENGKYTKQSNTIPLMWPT
jgi:hypothetical protein